MQRTEFSFRAANATPGKLSGTINNENDSPGGSAFSIKSFRPKSSKIPSPPQKDAATPAGKIMKKQASIYQIYSRCLISHLMTSATCEQIIQLPQSVFCRAFLPPLCPHPLVATVRMPSKIWLLN
jgi:hypothetical protein